MNAFLEAPNSKKMLTLVGIYLGLISQLIASTTFSGILRVAQNEFTDGSLWVLAASIGGILGLIVMPLYGYFGARNPALKRTLVCASMLIGSLVLLARALAPSMMVMTVASAFWALWLPVSTYWALRWFAICSNRQKSACISVLSAP
ncbi:MAG: hypothetical protein LBK67_04220 [Coriobacteriales bacterium]|nr:hypothetical protein [Coriobacteriales bacterium]